MTYPGAGGREPYRAGHWPPVFDESVWRRPSADAGAGDTGGPSGGDQAPASPAPAPPPAYAGPPRTVPPPAEWRPRTVVQMPEAHRLPAQDDARLDETERDNAAVTRGIGLLAGAIALILLIVVCGRLVF